MNSLSFACHIYIWASKMFPVFSIINTVMKTLKCLHFRFFPLILKNRVNGTSWWACLSLLQIAFCQKDFTFLCFQKPITFSVLNFLQKKRSLLFSWINVMISHCFSDSLVKGKPTITRFLPGWPFFIWPVRFCFEFWWVFFPLDGLERTFSPSYLFLLKFLDIKYEYL